MLPECGMWWSLKTVVDYDWLCDWTGACAINRPNYQRPNDYSVSRLYSAAFRRLIEYWTYKGVKVLEVKGLHKGKSRLIEKWIQGEEDSRAVGIFKEYKAVMEAVQFVGVMSMCDMLTREAVYADIEYLGVLWLRDMFEQY
jgi:hypothetical protein